MKLICTVLFVLITLSCSNNNKGIQYQKWYLTNQILNARPAEPMDNVAVKDPSIVFYNGQYHLFYTAKSKRRSAENVKYGISCAYVYAATLEGLNDAERFSIDSVAGGVIIAPQVFYFEPENCWYMIGHTTVNRNSLSLLKPVYLTNPDIENIEGWSKAKEIVTGRTDHEFWIDFWVICDDDHAYMFYANQKGTLFRLECNLDDFPEGFSQSRPEIALQVDHMDEITPWRMFEAVHIYYVKKAYKYLAILEGAYAHPSREGDVDARNRFIFGMTADSLSGAWERIEEDENEFLAEADHLFFTTGNPVPYTQVSHPELIRSGYNQRLEIADYNLTMVFQTFDGSTVPDLYNYNALPWELVLMKNHN